MKLAEDMVARGSITSSLNQILQGHLGTPQQFNPHNLRGVAHVSPTVTIHGDDNRYAGMAVSGQNGGLGLGNAFMANSNLSNRIMSDTVSCVSDMLWRTPEKDWNASLSITYAVARRQICMQFLEVCPFFLLFFFYGFLPSLYGSCKI